ncbi:MAG: L,D-transpeptidase family protein [Ilumatobacter sp.]|uniref:L,D-transpeptidase family protein n=1 Tax=Ilumatobacter sp. TaxID=1967498 RepID=UPI00261CE2F9|nr:L,D-transpeptidase family protein [Ilumatobacter sp.]MDJ0767222.1 L,D-transpeptidase family protein [Ilumatobacter sp.]
MSRSYVVLVAALVGVAGLAGVVALTQDDAGFVASADVDPPADDATTDPGIAVGDDDAAAADQAADTSGAVSDAAAQPIGAAAIDAAIPGGESDAGAPALADEVRQTMGLEPISVVDPECTLSIRLEVGMTDPEVACLESQLVASGVRFEEGPDEVFDEVTEAAVESFQARNGLVVDGVVGPQTANQLGVWVGPDVLPPDPATCPGSGRAAVVDRFNQRTWLCEAGEITELMPITTALSQPDPGTYEVYAKELEASSTISGDYSEMTHFVAFTYGKYQGARIAFHSIPTYPNGEYVQPLDSVGTDELHGASAGCIRVLPEDAELIWSWLDIGDTVKVVT